MVSKAMRLATLGSSALRMVRSKQRNVARKAAVRSRSCVYSQAVGSAFPSTPQMYTLQVNTPQIPLETRIWARGVGTTIHVRTRLMYVVLAASTDGAYSRIERWGLRNCLRRALRGVPKPKAVHAH